MPDWVMRWGARGRSGWLACLWPGLIWAIYRFCALPGRLLLRADVGAGLAVTVVVGALAP